MSNFLSFKADALTLLFFFFLAQKASCYIWQPQRCICILINIWHILLENETFYTRINFLLLDPAINQVIIWAPNKVSELIIKCYKSLCGASWQP